MIASDSRRGLTAARYIRARIMGGNTLGNARSFAAGQDWRDTPKVEMLLKADVSALATGDGGGLVGREIGADLVPLVRARSIIGRMTGLRFVPMDTRLIAQTSGATAEWGTEGAAIRVSKGAYSALTLARKRVRALAIVTKELAQSPQANAEPTIANDLVSALAEREDLSFIGNSAGSDAEPAGVTKAAPSLASSGATLADIDNDAGALIDLHVAGGANLDTTYWVMNPVSANFLGRVRGTGGALAYPAVSARGGVFMGLPVLTSNAVEHSSSPTDSIITLVDASRVRIADPGEVELAIATAASIEMQDAPINDSVTPSGSATSMVSMFQTNSVAIRVERWINWSAAAGAATVLTGVVF